MKEQYFCSARYMKFFNIVITGMVVMFLLPCQLCYALKTMEVTETHLEGGQLKVSQVERYHDEVFSTTNGWVHIEDKDFYIIEGKASSDLIVCGENVYLFETTGERIYEGSKEYQNYISLLDFMQEAKYLRDECWNYDCSGMSMYERRQLLSTYCKRYIVGADDISYAGFKFVDGILMIDLESPYLELEDMTRKFMNKFEGVEKLRERDRVRKIHDIVVLTFDYDYSQKNYSGSLQMALMNDKKMMCLGYAEIFHLVCGQYGLESEIIIGIGNKEPHAWNRVKINGVWKYIDCCWNDTSNSYKWFLLSKSKFDFDHMVS